MDWHAESSWCTVDRLMSDARAPTPPPEQPPPLPSPQRSFAQQIRGWDVMRSKLKQFQRPRTRRR